MRKLDQSNIPETRRQHWWIKKIIALTDLIQIKPHPVLVTLQ